MQIRNTFYVLCSRSSWKRIRFMAVPVHNCAGWGDRSVRIYRRSSLAALIIEKGALLSRLWHWEQSYWPRLQGFANVARPVHRHGTSPAPVIWQILQALNKHPSSKTASQNKRQTYNPTLWMWTSFANFFFCLSLDIYLLDCGYKHKQTWFVYMNNWAQYNWITLDTIQYSEPEYLKIQTFRIKSVKTASKWYPKPWGILWYLNSFTSYVKIATVDLGEIPLNVSWYWVFYLDLYW